MSDAVSRLAEVKSAIAAATAEAKRAEGSVTLVAVSKTFPIEAIEPVLAAGQRVFGENYVQDAKGKWPELRERYPDAEVHMIGPLQSNKAKEAVALFDVIETLDRPSLAKELAKEVARAKDAGARVPRFLVQVNTGAEPQKGGVLPEEADAFIRACRETYGLDVEGVMCIPPADEPPAPHFALLTTIARRNGLKTVSMGMSADYPTAIAMGATHVRVGSAIFGARG
ncbi:YggS family pyridoxal phosphate-dependent enzyme [Phreatobacter cathodiphilus]|uniref:Pyridoxal phosphate homeostasis protein n=1 Tax=Phreatobacter cathodiphilus TaxID=1868589 RepID=A0A2S0NF65_9HYPH|nr:YggS family pyridoxal phosphate-dependent enzyme [Phreatobacter cathodiphilus]AVO46802.1 YggS family pyridoxal phosphate-dependent enzyme [Phreatobacter cathodiphilus]